MHYCKLLLRCKGNRKLEIHSANILPTHICLQCTYLSFDMLQLICVFLCELTIMNGNCMAELDAGTKPRFSASLLRVTKLLNNTCCNINSRNCCCFNSIRSWRALISFSNVLHCCIRFFYWFSDQNFWNWKWFAFTCAELAGNPIQRISFLSFDIIFIAINTFKAS